MQWIPLVSEAQIDEIIAGSYHRPVAIYKHSTRCSVSTMVQKVLERDWVLPPDALPVYFLDLLACRSVSDRVAALLSVRHQSPQLILIRDGKAVYHASHSEIDYDEMVKHI